MFEQYPMTHCRFTKNDRESIMKMKSGNKKRDENYMPMIQADFSLDGCVDVLDYFPVWRMSGMRSSACSPSLICWP